MLYAIGCMIAFVLTIILRIGSYKLGIYKSEGWGDENLIDSIYTSIKTL